MGARLHQLFVPPLAHLFALLHDDDLVGVHDGGDIVGDYQNDAIFSQLLDCLHDDPLAFSVQRTGSLVEDKDFWVFIEGPSDC